MDLQSVALELYVVLPADFIATRTRLAMQARVERDRDLAKAIGALPKPTLAAWAVNLLVRARGEDVRELLTVGAHMREAQVAGSVEDLRELNRTQHDLLAAVRRQAEELARQAGKELSGPVAQRVQATLHAGMADPAAAEAVRSGVLVTDLASTGFGPVDISGAIAVPGVGAATGTFLPHAMSDLASPRPAVAPDAGETENALAHEAGSGVGDHAEATRSRPQRFDANQAGRDRGDRLHAGREEAERVGAAADRREVERREVARRDRLDARRRAERLAAEADAEADAAADAARLRLDDADATLEALAREAAEREEEIATLTARLRELRAAQTSAGVREGRARAGREQAARALDVALKAAARARDAVPGPPD